jgi:hypothetical protein
MRYYPDKNSELYNLVKNILIMKKFSSATTCAEYKLFPPNTKDKVSKSIKNAHEPTYFKIKHLSHSDTVHQGSVIRDLL